MNNRKINLKSLSTTAVAVAISFSFQQSARGDTTVETTKIMACGPLFSIDANADHKTAALRASIVQRNLDSALVASKNRGPSAVRVSIQNNNPIVTLDNFYIVTADKNSAVRAGVSQNELAEQWASSIRHCLMDVASLDKYISMLTGKFNHQQNIAQGMNRTDVAVLPWGMNMTVALQNDISVANATLGSPVRVALVTDVPMGPGFATYLPAGTMALGEMISAEPYNPNHHAGHNVLTPHFFALQTPDGAEIPISAHIYGGINSWRATSILPLKASVDTRVKAQIFTDINEGFSLNGTGGSKFLSSKTSDTVRQIHVKAFPGVIAGAWRGQDEDAYTQSGFAKLMLTPQSRLFIPAGERMTLQLASTSTVAVNSAANAEQSLAMVRSGSQL